MKLLLDTHILIWNTHAPKRLSRAARRYLEDLRNDLYFSVVSLWEIGVKSNLNRSGFRFDPRVLRRELLDAGYH